MKTTTLLLALMTITLPSIGETMGNHAAKKYVYYYFMEGTHEAISEAISQHVEYWDSLNLDNYQGGPFCDRSGGMIIFEAHDIQSAQRAVENDPFVVKNLIGDSWLKQWAVH